MPDLNLGRVGLSVLPLGVGDAFSVVHHPTCMIVSQYQTPAWDNGYILIDCPQAIRRMMREADDGRFHGLDLHRVNTLVLTHLHADHASGLETIAAFFKIAVGRKLRLVALPEVLEGVPRFLEGLKGLGSMEDLFDVKPIEPGKFVLLTSSLGDVTIEARKTSHPIPTAGLRISMEGKRVAYSCDTSFDEELWEWLWADLPDLVIHEVGHGIHTRYEDLVKHMKTPLAAKKYARHDPVATRLERLRLIHYPDDMLPMLEASPIQLCREGKLEVL